MNRPRRSARATPVPSQPRERVHSGGGDAACDGTALALVGGGGGDAEMERADAPEEIDTDEDDVEFEERAHWGRRRASAKKSGAKAAKKKAVEDDKRQPKINLFCVVQPQKTTTGDPSETVEERSAASDTAPVPTSPELLDSSSDVRMQQTEDDGNGGSSVVEVVVHTTVIASPTRATSLTSSGIASPLSKPVIPTTTLCSQDDTPSALLSPTMLSGRPKRQVVLKAEHALLQSSAEPVFTTPPAQQPTKETSASKATLDGEPDRKSTTNGNASAVASSGRKRKLEMAGEKSKTAAAVAKTPTKVRPKHAFFLTEQQKKEIIEIEAIETFKEQLREQRERDLAFYGNSEVKNPFFQIRSSSSSSQKVIDVDTPEIIEVMDSPEPSPAKQRKSRWAKELTFFPAVQHVLRETSHDNTMECAPTDELLPLPFKIRERVSDEVVVVDDDGDEIMESRPKPKKISPDEADAQIPFADLFWLLTSRPVQEADDLVLASLSGELSTNELVEKISEVYGIKEKHVRKTLASLDLARTKRQEKALNLSLVDKYLPVQTAGMIGNKAALKKLTAWLSAWKTGGSNDRDRSYDDSLFAFEGDDSEDDEDGTQLYRLFILEGDVGSGKSAAVYACAEELGYEIIEINAGQLRTGKAIVDIAGEATQSTRVLHNGGPVGDKKAKKSKSKKRRKGEEAAKPSHLSLVLFEDVDLVFEDDKGFLSTLGSIAKHSKCPIVVTCRHLPGNFPSSPPAISERLVRPTTREFIAWLSLVAHLEGIALHSVLASRLAELFACDIRRSLHFIETYRQHIGVNAIYHDTSLEWKPMEQLVVTVVGTDASAPITIASSQDEESLRRHQVPAWSRGSLRPFDLLDSNFLPLLFGSVCDRIQTNDVKNTWTLDEKVRHVESLEDLWGTLDGLSLADEWESVEAEHHRKNADDEDEGAAFFHAEALALHALDVRMLSLASFVARRERQPEVLSLQECSLADGVDRALQAARDHRGRDKKATHLAALKTKLELPSIVKGSERVGTRFCLDYLPLVSRILENSEPFQESRRRASRRNHYLGDVLLDMSAIDDIRAVDACFPPLPMVDGDEIVPLSASSPPPANSSAIDCISI